MLRYLRPLTEPFSNRYRQYLPLATSTPRASVSAASGSTSLYPDSRPPSPTSPTSPTFRKAGLRRRSASWHIRLLLLLLICAYALHTALRSVFFPTPSGASEEARSEALKLLQQQLSAESLSPTTDQSSGTPIATSVHRLLPGSSPGVASREVLPIRAYSALSDACVESWVVHHRWGPDCLSTDLSAGLTFDAVWAWVNGSDPAQILARNAYRPSSPINVDAAHRYADHNELLYSMRSLYKAFGEGTVGKMHVMASAYPLPGGEGWVGQVPYWLNATEEGGLVEVHHDAEVFKPMQRPSPYELTEGEVDEWRRATLPSFNSLAVESQLYNLPHTSSDQLVYLNDDFFTLTPSSISDVHSPLFGPVIKTDTRLISWYRPSQHPFQRLWNPAGEEVGIKRAAWVLGRRFAMRSLPYITHHPRSLSLPLLREAAAMFPDAFGETTLARFRAQKEVPDSVQAVTLASWFVVERHREALLWSWIVAKWASSNGEISAEVKRLMWEEIAGTDARDSLHVRRPVRRSREDDGEAFDRAGVPRPKNTQYSFSSQDGHALSYLDWSWPWQRTRNGYPDLSHTTRPHARSWFASSGKACRLSLTKCFQPSHSESASSLFRRIAFEQLACGDCLIAALINVSGPQGISAFLPSPDTTVHVQPGSTPHLPLTSTWAETDFSLAQVLPKGEEVLQLRTWCTRLIQRYIYTLGATPSTFYKVEYASRLPGQLKAVDDTLTTREPTTFVCLNDDIKESEQGTERLTSILQGWFQGHWSAKLPGEIK